jgi:hypothetical protein
MKKLTVTGPYLYATAIAAFGVIQLVTQNFLTGMLPVPAGLPGRLLWVDLSSFLWLMAAAGIFLWVRPPWAAGLAGVVFFAFFFILHLPKLLGNIYDPNEWTAAFETIMLGSGGFIIAANFGFPQRQWNKWAGIAAIAGLYLFALSLLVFAVLHIKYNEYIQTLIPGWMPAHVFLSYVVIAAFLLSAFSFLTHLKLQMAAIWLGVMYLLWVLTLHGPRAIGKLNVEPEWTSLFVALAVGGIAFCIYQRGYKGEIGKKMWVTSPMATGPGA